MNDAELCYRTRMRSQGPPLCSVWEHKESGKRYDVIMVDELDRVVQLLHSGASDAELLRAQGWRRKGRVTFDQLADIYQCVATVVGDQVVDL